MDRLISEQAVLDVITEAIRIGRFYCGKERTIEEIKAIPSAEPKTGWVSVSERLPEENGDYLVTLENGVITKLGYSTTQRTTYPKGFYYVEGGFSWRQTINPVIAWMPLPLRYKPQEREG